MTDDEIVNIMIKKVEEVVRDKVKEAFDETKPGDRKAVAKSIIKELEMVLNNENKKDII